MIRLTASDFHTYFHPQKCECRVYHRHKGRVESPPSPFEQLLFQLGKKHEKSHLSTFPMFTDLSEGSIEEREQSTKEEINNKASVIYHAILRTKHVFDGVECEIVGEPDFLILEGDNYIIRDSKMSRRINKKEHPEILWQLEFYEWIYEQTYKKTPSQLQVFSGAGDVVDVPYDNGAALLQVLAEIVSLKLSESEPYSPVGWTKCGGCPFHDYCWSRAEKNRSLSLIPGVDQNLVRALRDIDINTIEELLEGFDENNLANFKRPWGQRIQRVGKNAGKIILRARALQSGSEIIIAPPALPELPNYVMFDLEGLPPFLDELDKIYLWGLQVFGQDKGDFMPAVADFGEEGDKIGWFDFLENTRKIFNQYGDVPFVHWHHYERVQIDKYVKRYGDIGGIAERVKSNLLDMLPITQNSIALPIPSYSLKVVEKYVGYKRQLDETGGDWAIAQYIEATETEDINKRDEIVERILDYNREDLEATWAVLTWLKSKTS